MSKEPKFDFKPWRYDRFDSPCSEVGSQFKDELSARRNDDGNIEVVVVGKINVYDQIQSFAESVDINAIMRRYEAGDSEVLNKVQGFFGDTVGLPQSWSEVFNTINEGRANFEKLPPEFKEIYGNDFERFACTFDISNHISSVDEPPPETPAVIKEEGAE